MANSWLRLWIDLPNDPKFRTVAKVSAKPISVVISVYIHMLCCAANATERGRTEGWCDEDIGTALDINTDDVVSIREAMQGRLLDGDYLTGWEKRQPIKEDGAADRAKAYRERLKQEKLQNTNEFEQIKTQPNATERNRTLEEIREEEKRLDKSKPKSKTTTTPDGVVFDGVPDQVVEDFKKHRKAKRAAITQTAIDQIHAEAVKAGISLADALTLCCSRGWVGFEAGWLLRDKPGARASPEGAKLGTHGQATAANAKRWLDSQKNDDDGIGAVA